MRPDLLRVRAMKRKRRPADHTRSLAELRLHNLNTVSGNLSRDPRLCSHGVRKKVKMRFANASAKYYFLGKEGVQEGPCGRSRALHSWFDDLVSPMICGH